MLISKLLVSIAAIAVSGVAGTLTYYGSLKKEDLKLEVSEKESLENKIDEVNSKLLSEVNLKEDTSEKIVVEDLNETKIVASQIDNVEKSSIAEKIKTTRDTRRSPSKSGIKQNRRPMMLNVTYNYGSKSFTIPTVVQIRNIKRSTTEKQ